MHNGVEREIDFPSYDTYVHITTTKPPPNYCDNMTPATVILTCIPHSQYARKVANFTRRPPCAHTHNIEISENEGGVTLMVIICCG